MIRRQGSRLPPTAWSAPFALVMVVAAVETLLLVYLLAASQQAVAGDFLLYQWFINFWTAGGVLERGMSFEFMKLNILLTVYIWLMSRTMHPRDEAVHRLSLLGAALMLLGFQIALAMTSDLARPRFVLVPVDDLPRVLHEAP